MAIVTTYICDVSGKTGDKDDFVEVKITPKRLSSSFITSSDIIVKVIHKDVAIKLGLVPTYANEISPEVTPTFESQLSSLLKDYISDLVYDEVASQTNRS